MISYLLGVVFFLILILGAVGAVGYIIEGWTPAVERLWTVWLILSIGGGMIGHFLRDHRV